MDDFFDGKEVLLQVDMPYKVRDKRKTMDDKWHNLNLNNYRNWQSHMNGKLKVNYKEDNGYLFDGIQTIHEPVDIYFQFIKRDRRTVDKSNVFSVMSKFTYDVMVDRGVFVDDNDNYIKFEGQLPTIYGNKDLEEHIGRFTVVKSQFGED